MIVPDRHWLLTWTTYGTWLPGDARGLVTSVRAADEPRHRHNTPGTPYDPGMSGLRASAAKLVAPAVYLTAEQAVVVVAQFRETAAHRGWLLLAAAVMRNHAHVLVGVPGDPEPDTLLRDFKSYASRALNARWPRPASGTWWTQSGSKRKRTDVPVAACYVRDQQYALAVWVADGAFQGEGPGERRASAR